MFINPDNPLAAEILQEAGEVYFSACKKMVSSLEALRAFDTAVAPVIRGDEQAACRSQLLDDAAKQVYFVLIQRDAMQLSGSETFLDDYGIPAEVIAWMGQRQRK
jgi:hypothetical protein